MSELGDVTAAVVGLLSALQREGHDLFATVGIYQAAERKAAVAALSRQRKPAAFVLYDGRGSRTHQDTVPAAATVTILLAVENLRGGAAALTGDASCAGVWEGLERVAAALDGATLAGDYRLLMHEERQAAGDERTVVFEQRYRVERLAELSIPTFGGAAITGSDSIVTVEIGGIAVESVKFGFPGIDGVYRHHAGTRGRTIRWQGQLVAEDDAALNEVEGELERLAVAQVPATMVDAWGRSYPECVLDVFERQGARRRHPVTGAAVQGFELTFTQLRV